MGITSVGGSTQKNYWELGTTLLYTTNHNVVMAYVRKKTVKGHDYFYKVKSVRTAKGPRQKVVRYLGKPLVWGETGQGKAAWSARIFPPRKYFLDLSIKTGFIPRTLERVYRLVELLFVFQKNPMLKKLVLSGGTALNFMFFKTPRLSVDIDLIYVSSEKRGDMEKDREAIRKEILEVAGALGYRAKEIPRPSHATETSWLLKYQDTTGHADNVKVEINWRERVPILKVRRKAFKHMFSFPKFKVLTYQAEELIGHKISALVERGAPRDYFDVYNLSKKKIRLDKQLLKKCVLFYCLIGKTDARKIRSPADKVKSDAKFRDHITDLLARGKTEGFEVSKVRKGALAYVRPLFKLTKTEEAFFKEVFDERKAPDFKKLFGKTKTSNLLKHPQVQVILHKQETGKPIRGRRSREQ